MRIWHLSVILLKVKQVHFETAFCDSAQFFCLLLRLKVFRSITFKDLYDSNTEYNDADV